MERSSHEYSNCWTEPFQRSYLCDRDHRIRRLGVCKLHCFRRARPVSVRLLHGCKRQRAQCAACRAGRRAPVARAPSLRTVRTLSPTTAMPRRVRLIMSFQCLSAKMPRGCQGGNLSAFWTAWKRGSSRRGSTSPSTFSAANPESRSRIAFSSHASALDVFAHCE